MRVFNTIHGHELLHCLHDLEHVGPRDGSEERLERVGPFHTPLEAHLRDVKSKLCAGLSLAIHNGTLLEHS